MYVEGGGGAKQVNDVITQQHGDTDTFINPLSCGLFSAKFCCEIKGL